MKPGIKTTELWVTLISQLITAIVAIICVVYGVDLEADQLTTVVATGGAFIASAVTAVYYIRGRIMVKTQKMVVDVQAKAYGGIEVSGGAAPSGQGSPDPSAKY